MFLIFFKSVVLKFLNLLNQGIYLMHSCYRFSQFALFLVFLDLISSLTLVLGDFTIFLPRTSMKIQKWLKCASVK